MPADIGDDVAVTTTIRVDGTLTDPVSVVLTVTDPAGAVTTPAIDHPSTGVYEALVPATSAGRWHTKWTTTTPTGVEHGYFDVSPDAPPGLSPLATVSDLEDRLGPLTDAQAAKAPALLRDASALIRRYTRQTFDLVDDDVAVLRPVGMVIRLPRRPVRAVTSVAAVWGDEPEVTLTGWGWDGLDKINLAAAHADPDAVTRNWYADAYRVTYDHGYPQTPDDIVALVCAMTSRTLTSPSQVEGMVSEQIVSYSYQLQQGSGSVGPSVRLTDADKTFLAEAGYRRRSTTVAVSAS
jgi:hypothetical protein